MIRIRTREAFGLCLLVLFSFLTPALAAQEPSMHTVQQLEGRADALEQEEEADDSYVLQWEYYRKHPLNLNKAGEDDLHGLRLLTPLQVKGLLQYRSLLGNLTSLSELQAVPGWDTTTITRILPFVTVQLPVLEKSSASRLLREGEGILLLNLSRRWKPGTGSSLSSSTRHLGDPNRVYLRYHYNYKNLLQYGFLGEKDAGEPFLGSQHGKGFDHYSFHLFVRTAGAVKALAIGDYTVQVGQGLLQWQSLGFGKSSEVLQVKRQGPTLIPYRSPGEFHFNRGLGITLQKGRWENSFFVSSLRRSANAAGEIFSGFITTGLHRTQSEIEDRRSVSHQSFGTVIRYNTGTVSVGLNGVAHRFSHYLQPSRQPYRLYALSGKQFWNASLDYAGTWRNLHLFGEVAVDQQVQVAQVHGALLSLEKRVDLALHLRLFPPQFKNIFGNAFSESSLPVNENGLYLGIAVRPARQWQLQLYGDFFRFPWLRYRIDAPGGGAEYLAQVEYTPDKFTQFYLLYRRGEKPFGLKGMHTDFLSPSVRQNLRLHVSMAASPALELRIRSEAVWLRRADVLESGWLCYMEGIYKSRKMSISGRVLYFDADSYNSRLYAFETDVPYSLTIPSFYNSGLRYYLQVKYPLLRKCTFWLRWAQTIPLYSSRNISGVETGAQELKTQFIFHLF